MSDLASDNGSVNYSSQALIQDLDDLFPTQGTYRTLPDGEELLSFDHGTELITDLVNENISKALRYDLPAYESLKTRKCKAGCQNWDGINDNPTTSFMYTFFFLDGYETTMKKALDIIGNPETNTKYNEENTGEMPEDAMHAIPDYYFALFDFGLVFEESKIVMSCGRWELSPTSNALHFQGLLVLNKQVRPSSLALKLYKQAAGVVKIHIQPAYKLQGAQAYSYDSQKEGALHGYHRWLKSYNPTRRTAGGGRELASGNSAEEQRQTKRAKNDQARIEKWEQVTALVHEGKSPAQIFAAVNYAIDLARIITFRDELLKSAYKPRLPPNFTPREWQSIALQQTMEKVAMVLDPARALDDNLRKLTFYIGPNGNEGKSVAVSMIEDAIFTTYKLKAVALQPTSSHFSETQGAAWLSVSNQDTCCILLNIGRTFDYTNWGKNFEPLIESWLDGRTTSQKYKGASAQRKYVVVVFCNKPPPEHERGLTADRYDLKTCTVQDGNITTHTDLYGDFSAQTTLREP